MINIFDYTVLYFTKDKNWVKIVESDKKRGQVHKIKIMSP